MNTRLSRPPKRIVLILPCCIGDVVMATATLSALRSGFPDASITWAVGAWSRPAIEHHPHLDDIIEIPADVSFGGLRILAPPRLASDLRAGNFDLAVSLERSPLMSVSLLLSGIPERAGLDSGRRGFGYTIRVPLNPDERRHEAEIYLSVAAALGIPTAGFRANIPLRDADRAAVAQILGEQAIEPPYIVVHPGGGSNPGMTMTSKRYPPAQMAALAERTAETLGARIILIGAKRDTEVLEATQRACASAPVTLAGRLTFGEIGALAAGAALYLGNDTGLTHLAAAAGAPTAMIFGPSDPVRYAPYTDNAIVLWKPVEVPTRGVSAGTPQDFDWERDGISVDEAAAQIRAFLRGGIDREYI
ncbi:glycosyltransferase family 9 protein [Oscillatoria laete-virens NRMC-F 0139]|nr:glycosyltransferase family 9 protein [Oscillatoria laete-virens]MDL5055791.1 glycosyltransferase family 9 protein [Oscillatoria laete-virens NRMC-F 0139]